MIPSQARDVSHRRDQPRPEWRPDPKMGPYQIGEDIENCLLWFEHISWIWNWTKTESTCRLIPLLSGKALEAYTTMD